MRNLFYIILSFVGLLMASCRSHKAVQYEMAEVVCIDGQINTSIDSAARVLDFLRAASELELSGIAVEFFEPDSLHPEIRAVPKSVRIDKANVKEYSEAVTLSSSEVVANETVNLRTNSSTEVKHELRSDVNTLSLPVKLLAIPLLLSLGVAGVLIYLKYSRKK